MFRNIEVIEIWEQVEWIVLAGAPRKPGWVDLALRLSWGWITLPSSSSVFISLSDKPWLRTNSEFIYSSRLINWEFDWISPSGGWRFVFKEFFPTLLESTWWLLIFRRGRWSLFCWIWSVCLARGPCGFFSPVNWFRWSSYLAPLLVTISFWIFKDLEPFKGVTKSPSLKS